MTDALMRQLDVLAERTANSIIHQNASCKAHERVIVYTDGFDDGLRSVVGGEDICAIQSLYGFIVNMDELSNRVNGFKIDATKRHGSEPPEEVWRSTFGSRAIEVLSDGDLLWKLRQGKEISANDLEAAKKIVRECAVESANVVVALSWFSTTHTNYRLLATAMGTRFISIPMLSVESMRGAMQADLQILKYHTAGISEILRRARKMLVMCGLGTSLEVGVPDGKRILVDDGDFTVDGACGNLPAGEVYFAPVAGSTRGTVAITNAPGYENVDLTIAEVEDGLITRFIKQTMYSDKLESLFFQDFNMRNVGELGIGTNHMARSMRSVTEREKIVGTAHFALGDNYDFGGGVKAIEHLDHVIGGGTVRIFTEDGNVFDLIRDGKLQIPLVKPSKREKSVG